MQISRPVNKAQGTEFPSRFLYKKLRSKRAAIHWLLEPYDDPEPGLENSRERSHMLGQYRLLSSISSGDADAGDRYGG